MLLPVQSLHYNLNVAAPFYNLPGASMRPAYPFRAPTEMLAPRVHHERVIAGDYDHHVRPRRLQIVVLIDVPRSVRLRARWQSLSKGQQV